MGGTGVVRKQAGENRCRSYLVYPCVIYALVHAIYLTLVVQDSRLPSASEAA